MFYENVNQIESFVSIENDKLNKGKGRNDKASRCIGIPM